MIAIAVLIFASGLVIGIFMPRAPLSQDDGLIQLKVMGDIENPGITDIEPGGLEVRDIDGDKKYTLSLDSVLDKTVPLSDEHMIYFIGNDGRTASMTGGHTSSSYLVYKDSGLFDIINYDHPVSTNIKGIEEIVIVSTSDRLDIGLNIIDPENNIENITTGEAYLSKASMLEFGGASTKDSSYGPSKGWVYEKKYILDLESFIGELPEGPYVLMGKKGGYAFTYDMPAVEITDSGFDLIGQDIEAPFEDLAGIVLDPPSASIMDAYHDTIAYVQDGQSVMVVLVDGFSYTQFKEAYSKGYISFIKDKGPVSKALSVYRPVTNSGLAAMVTGQPPYLNGIYSRDFRELKAPDIFEVLSGSGYSSALVEGDIGVIGTSIDPILNTDKDGDGSTDDEIFESALGVLDRDMVFIHFHGLDDRGHDYGDLDPRTLEYLKVIDRYIKGLLSKWEGKMIITADHGMHSTGSGGDHGEFRYEDLVVPYIVIGGDS